MPRFPRHSPTADELSDAVFGAAPGNSLGRDGVDVYPLHVGDTYLEPPACARAEAQLTSTCPRLHNYAPVQGEPRLLDAIEARHGGQVPRECIQVMSGATAGLSVVCQTLLDPGDEVLLPAPYWPLIRGIIAARGAVPIELPLFDRIDDPTFDLRAVLEDAITPRTAALYVNSPNNPTGRVLSCPALNVVAEVANQHDLWVIADEAYESLCYCPGSLPAPLWQREDLRQRTIATHTLSKSHGLAGSRVGYTHGPAEIMRAIRAMQTFHTYCAPRPLQLGAARAILEADDWVADARRRYAAAGRAAAEALGVAAPEAGTFLFFDARPHFGPEETLTGFLARCLQAGVLLTPGTSCGRDYAGWARLCFTAVPPDELDRALSRLRTVLGRY